MKFREVFIASLQEKQLDLQLSWLLNLVCKLGFTTVVDIDMNLVKLKHLFVWYAIWIEIWRRTFVDPSRDK